MSEEVWIISKNPTAVIKVGPQRRLEPGTRRVSGFARVCYVYIFISGCLFQSLLFSLCFSPSPIPSSLCRRSHFCFSQCICFIFISFSLQFGFSFLDPHVAKFDAPIWLWVYMSSVQTNNTEWENQIYPGVHSWFSQPWARGKDEVV